MGEANRGLRSSTIAPVVFAIALSFVPALAPTPDEMFVMWSPPMEAPAGTIWRAVESDEPSLSLQDFFAFGDLGLPPGVPGSFPLNPADQAALETALRESEASPLNSAAGVAALRAR